MNLIATVDRSLIAVIPAKQLLYNSLQIKASSKRFEDWSQMNHADSYRFMRSIATTWKNANLTDQYLIYGKIDSSSFNWEIVPYQKCRTLVGRVVQQTQVLWRTIFGGVSLGSSQLKYDLIATEPESAPRKSDDSFCNDKTIERQWVITGKKVNVLYNYAPIGFGGEKLHFLVVPKNHRETFTDLTKEEYCESLALTKQMVDHFKKTRKNILNVYLLNKSGVDAGQTVKHWHLHVIFSTHTTQDFWGKLTAFKNILFGSSPMKSEDLAKKVGDLRSEFEKSIL